MKSHVDFDENIDLTARTRQLFGPGACDVEMIDDEREARAIEESDQAWGVHRMERVWNPDVFDARIDEHFNLAQLRAADADGAALDLPPGDERALVRLRMRPHP